MSSAETDVNDNTFVEATRPTLLPRLGGLILGRYNQFRRYARGEITKETDQYIRRNIEELRTHGVTVHEVVLREFLEGCYAGEDWLHKKSGCNFIQKAFAVEQSVPAWQATPVAYDPDKDTVRLEPNGVQDSLANCSPVEVYQWGSPDLPDVPRPILTVYQLGKASGAHEATHRQQRYGTPGFCSLPPADQRLKDNNSLAYLRQPHEVEAIYYGGQCLQATEGHNPIEQQHHYLVTLS